MPSLLKQRPPPLHRQYPYFKEQDTHNPMGILVPAPDAPEDPSRWLSPELPEWCMEKYRFYLDLPGDFWEGGQLMRYLREREVPVVWDQESKAYVMPWSGFTRLGEVRTELQVMDPGENWAFLSWLLDDRKLRFFEQAAAFALFVRGCSIAINIISSTKFVKFIAKKRAKKNRKQNMWERLTKAPAREFMTRDAKTGQLRDTGVRFQDIAGMPGLVFEMREVVKMLLGDDAYKRVGARVPRGIIFQGPPGTGKTYLARAIAGEAGVTFLSAVGSEFVEMYAGVAAARVNSLYHSARKKAPCIIFIDEIDAIGRSRSTLGADPGSMERESALLAMLVAMDGIHGNLEQVLTIGATNLAQELDQALLRPGRFEVVYEIPTPGPTARMEILKIHSRNKPLEGDAMLTRVAEVTQGWSAAALANLMNEAAILTVRRGVEKITLPMVLEVIEAQEWGPGAPKIPPSEAKDRLALVTAAKAVALALTPGVEPIKFVTMWSRRKGQGPFVEFIQSEESLDPNWHPEEIEAMDWKTNFKVNAAVVGDEPLGEWFHVAGLLLPLYAPRAFETDTWGPDAASLATAAPIADAFELAYYCVRNSQLHPRFRSLPPLHTYVYLGEDANWVNQRDSLAPGLDEELGYHKLTLTLLKAAWERTRKLVQERRPAIELVAKEMVAAPDERLSGTRLVEIIETTPLGPCDINIDSDFMPILSEVLGRRMPEVMARAEELTRQQQEQQQHEEGQAGAREAQAPGDEQYQEGQEEGPSREALEGQEGAAAAPAGDRLKLDAATLRLVSKAVMGRLDVVDLVGRNTAEELAERVVDTLLHPETVERIRAVRQFVEAPSLDPSDSPFPPAPPLDDVPGPLYGALHLNLDWWRQRRVDVFGGGAAELLMTERQLQYYRRDMDVSAWEDTAEGMKAAAAAKQDKGNVQQQQQDQEQEQEQEQEQRPSLEEGT
ncbi:cell division protease FtsH [Monoraphidium neglectum]|uniref:Cell division protease FtsH n=1 Tax=Monoraphidium neglectum TaxID=145388 RepID=A0A0D2MQ70_9CHLO|nr:cell division protease FtsH [Monoraphidium neglectum]KIZ04815.1 cell division protease FtsH [Monoraphidium neglectum]|eukprot:XP_013903834.1 cell division protease FtsH [Monoraphidium neglectum]